MELNKLVNRLLGLTGDSMMEIARGGCRDGKLQKGKLLIFHGVTCLKAARSLPVLHLLVRQGSPQCSEGLKIPLVELFQQEVRSPELRYH